MFIAHALLKYFVFTPAGTVAVLRVAGAAGLARLRDDRRGARSAARCSSSASTRAWSPSRWCPVLLGATWAHLGNGWLFTSPKGGWEYPAFLTLAAVVVGLLGDGRYSVTARIGKARTFGGQLQRAA